MHAFYQIYIFLIDIYVFNKTNEFPEFNFMK